MSKWNVKTADGRLTDVSAIATTATPAYSKPAAGGGDLEASNPMFAASKYPEKSAFSSPVNEQAQSDSCLIRCGSRLERPKVRIAIAICIFFVIVIVVLFAVLFPRYPVVDIDRNATADEITVDKVSLGNNIWRVFGNATVVMNNPNVYPISIAGMEVNGTIGRNPPNQVSFYQAIGALEIAANGISRFRLPVDLVIPPEVDKVALANEITSDCIANLNKLKTLMSGRARVNFLGSQLTFSFGPQYFEARCL